MRLISLVEIQLATGTLYLATEDGVIDDSGNIYSEKVVGHPVLEQRLSHAYFGTADRGALSVSLANLDETLTTVFSSPNEPRDKLIIVRRMRLDVTPIDYDDPDQYRTIAAAKIDQVTFSTNGTIDLVGTDQAAAALAVEFPRQRVDPHLVSQLTESQAVDATIPIVFGAVREHIPCRYVEANETDNYYRYIACLDFWPLYNSALGTFAPLVRPNINSVYVGTTGGVSLIPASEYEVEWVANDPLRVTTGFSAAPVLTAPNSGSLTGTYWYKVGAYNRYGLVALSDAATIDVTSKKVTVTWTAVHNASMYRIWGRPATEGGTYGVLATVGGHDTVTWEDDGTATPYTAALPAPAYTVPTWDYTATTPSVPNVVSVIFRTIRYNGASQLAPILADIETTELAPTAATKALWLFRNSTRNIASATLANANELVTSRIVHLWTFKAAFAGDAFCADSIGTSDLTNGGFDATYLADTYYGRQVLTLRGSGDLVGTGDYSGYTKHAYLVRDDSLDMEFDATTSFRIEATIRPEYGTGGKTLTIVAKGGQFELPGYSFKVQSGALYAQLCDDDVTLTARGTTPLDGGWHEVAMDVDRVGGYLKLYVDGELEATTDILGLGDLTTRNENIYYGTFRIGAGESLYEAFEGSIDRVAVLSGYGSPYTYVHGKADSGTNALDLSNMWEAPYVLGTQASGLDPGTDSLCVSVWFYPLTIQAGDGGVLVAKSDGANGWDLACEDVSGTGRVTAHLHRNGTTHEVTSSATIVANRWYLATLQVVRESVGAAGSVTLYVNGSASTAATILAASPTNITTTAACVVGALDTISSCKFDGYIDEVHIEVGVSTTGTDARGLASHRHCFFMGTRNAVRQMRTLLTLHDCNFTLNATSWDTAEDAFAAVADENSVPHALACDYAMVEIAPLRQHLQEMLRLRGIRLALNTSGEWTCTVDTQQAATGAAGWRDGVWENCVKRPVWTRSSLEQAIRTLSLKYRRKRVAEGAVDRYLRKAAPRTVLTVGPTEETPLEAPAIRTQTCADIVADYTAKRLLHADRTCRFQLGEDGWDLGGLGDVMTVYDPTAGVTEEDRTIAAIVDSGMVYDIETVGWASSIYTYTPADDGQNSQLEIIEEHLDVGEEDAPDYSFTYPDPPTQLSVSFDAETRHATVTWTPPDSDNFQDSLVGWREEPTSATDMWRPFVSAGSTQEASMVVTGIAKAGTYQFRVASRNRAGLLSIWQFVTGPVA